VSRDQRVGVIITQYPPPTGQDVLIQSAGQLV
jgi:hypothetical protein